MFGLGNIGAMELVIIGSIVLLIFGPRKLPALSRSIGESIREFRKSAKELTSSLENEITK